MSYPKRQHKRREAAFVLYFLFTSSFQTSMCTHAQHQEVRVHCCTKSGHPCALVHKIRASVCTGAQNRTRTQPFTKSRDIQNTSWQEKASIATLILFFSCDKVLSFGRFPAWGHPKGLLYPQSSNAQPQNIRGSDFVTLRSVSVL